MSTPSTLRFRARGTALVPNHEHEAAGVRSFVGRKLIEVKPGVYGFDPTNSAVELPYRSEYVKYCRDGDLYAADAGTAAACGVEFDPAFGEAKAQAGGAAPAHAEEEHQHFVGDDEERA